LLHDAAVGAEREWRRSPASLRASVLISLASAAFGVIATGVGFFGGGAILREGASVTGLSTAATIWCVAVIGAQAGAQESVGAIWPTVLVLAVNLVLQLLQRFIRRKRPAKPSEEDAALEG